MLVVRYALNGTSYPLLSLPNFETSAETENPSLNYLSVSETSDSYDMAFCRYRQVLGLLFRYLMGCRRQRVYKARIRKNI